MHIALLSILTIISVSSCSLWTEPYLVSSYPSGLHVDLYARQQPFRDAENIYVNGRVVNKGKKRIQFYAHDLIDSHAIGVYDAKGKRMVTIPPSQPLSKLAASRYRRALAPDEGFDVRYELNIFSPALSDGRYGAKVEHCSSDMIKFTVNSEKE